MTLTRDLEMPTSAPRVRARNSSAIKSTRTDQLPRPIHMASGDSSKSIARGDRAIAGSVGKGSTATAQGADAVAVAGGSHAHATLLKGNSAEAAAAAGLGCIVETFDGNAYIAAVGTGAMAISHRKDCPSVAVGHESLSIAPDDGDAVSVGSSNSAMAGAGGALVFVDTSALGGPFTAIFKVGKDGILPNTPYWWQAGMHLPEVDDLWLEWLEVKAGHNGVTTWLQRAMRTN